MTRGDRHDLEELLDKKLVGVATREDLAKFQAKMAGKEDLANFESGIRQVLEDSIIPQLDRLHRRITDLSDAIERIGRQLEAVVDRQDRQDEILKSHERNLADHEQRLVVLDAHSP